MAHHFDEHELLALIEGQLTDSEAANLRRRLQSDPALLASVDHMIAQRNAMRSLKSPQLPCDFVAELEPMLVRAMLVEPVADAASTNGQAYVPGQARRAKQAAGSQIPWWMRYATAAGLVIAATAGLWAAAAGLGLLGANTPATTPGGSTVAKAGPGTTEPHDAVASAGSDTSSDESVLWPDDATGEFHHALTIDNLLASNTPPVGTDAPGTRPEPASPVTPNRLAANFALLLEHEDVDRAEAAMLASLEARADSAALVRNFSFADATALEAQWHAARRSEPALTRPRMASITGTEANRQAERFFRELASRATSQLRALRSRNADAQTASAGDALLLGSRDLAADTIDQLRYSSAGATHTLSVRAADLGSVLMQLTNAELDSQAMLALFEPVNILDNPLETPRGSELTAAQRIRQMLDVRQALDELLAADPDAIVLLPVVVQTDD